MIGSRFRIRCALVLFASFATWLASCNGSSHSSPAVPAGAINATALAVLTLRVPRTSTSGHRRLAYVSAATQSVSIRVGPVGGPLGVPVVSSCTALTCTVTVEAPIGPDTFAVSTFDGASGSGNVLASGTVQQTIEGGRTNVVSATLDGTIASVALTLPSSNVVSGVAVSLPLTVTAKDAGGYTIIGPGAYSVPISIADSDASGATSVTPAGVTVPGTPVNFTYNGRRLNGTITLAPQAAGIPSSKLGAVALRFASVGTPYQHIVIVIQENRSFDNLFGDPQAKAQIGAIDTVAAGAAVACTPQPPPGTPCPPVPLRPYGFDGPFDPDHTHMALVGECHPVTPPPSHAALSASCYMDGFAREGMSSFPAPANTNAYKYLPAVDIAPYIALARSYGIADHLFAGGLTPSFPAHQQLVAGLSTADNPASTPWTCGVDGDAPLFATAPFPNPSPTPVPVVPGCLTYPTLATAIDAIPGATWHYYTGSTPQPDFWDGLVNAYAAVRAIYYSTPAPVVLPSAAPTTLTEFQRNVVPRAQFFSDVAQTPRGRAAAAICTLPTVSWITPDGGYSDHASFDVGGNRDGPWWVATIYNAIAQSPCYATTAMLVTWDDSGGWYDHEPPPLAPNAAPAAFSGYRDRILGMRVPLIFIAPNAVPQHVSHTVRDFGAILRFIENDIGAAPLGGEDIDFNGEALTDMYGPAATVTPIPPSQLMSSATKAYTARYFESMPEKPPDNE